MCVYGSICVCACLRACVSARVCACVYMYMYGQRDSGTIIPMAFVLHHDTFKHRQADTLLNMAKGKMLAVEE